ncbi:MAG: tryptophan synthase subunit alpha [Thermoanaerobaculia bacterium]|nr:tryptophan synthase subunit alpha [Thermoanaerobaculia bacterium]
MSIVSAFARARTERRAAFIPYITAGDPDLAATERLAVALAAAGADILELGVPFSDPIADGPVNQAAAARALASGTTLVGILALVARLRPRLGIPVVLFTYFNPLHAYGVARFAEHAAASGVDGILCVDLPPEEAEGEYLDALRAHGLDAIFLLAPTSTRERVRAVARLGSGFVYYVSRTGVTGEQGELPEALAREAKALGKALKLPLAVGFGISTRPQVAAVARVADGVVVGSALVRLIGEAGNRPGLEELVFARAQDLAAGTRRR